MADTTVELLSDNQIVYLAFLYKRASASGKIDRGQGMSSRNVFATFQISVKTG